MFLPLIRLEDTQTLRERAQVANQEAAKAPMLAVNEETRSYCEKERAVLERWGRMGVLFQKVCTQPVHV